MERSSHATTPPATCARLVIPRTDPAVRGANAGMSPLARLRAWVAGSWRGRSMEPLRIQDSHGEVLVALDDASAGVEVALAPGTYHVTVGGAGVQRRYTIRLDAGAALTLQVASP